MAKFKSKISAPIAIVILLGIFAVVLLCHFSAPDNPVAEITSINISSDYPLAVNLSQMADAAEVVVMGKYSGFHSKWNMARDPENIKNEDSDHYVEGRLYNFVIDEVLKGDVDAKQIRINHRYFEVMKTVETNATVDKEGIIVKEATQTKEVAFKVNDPLFIEPDQNGTYILFLLRDPDFGNYYAAVEPFMIKIADGIAILQSNLINNTSGFKQSIREGSRAIEVTFGIESIDDTISGQPLEVVKKTILSH